MCWALPRWLRQRSLVLVELSFYRRSQVINKISSGRTNAVKKIKLGDGLESNREGEA